VKYYEWVSNLILVWKKNGDIRLCVDKYKNTFTTRWGTLSYERMPFGLINASTTFQRAMQIAFDDLIGKIIQIYLDDLTIYSRNQQDHI